MYMTDGQKTANVRNCAECIGMAVEIVQDVWVFKEMYWKNKCLSNRPNILTI